MAAALPEELVEEILLRVPPDEPAFLVRAALVCKAWRRILLSDGDGDGDGGGSFRRRYRRFHRTPPLLGYIHNVGFHAGPRFVPTSSFSPTAPPAPTQYSAWAIDCRHGRVLIHSRDDEHESEPLIVWDPVTGSQQRLSLPAYTYPPYRSSWAAAVLCAVDGCDHIDCHGGGGRPFLVVFVEARIVAGGAQLQPTCTYCASVYTSQTNAWSAPAAPHVNANYYSIQKHLPSLLIGDALYFTLRCDARILRYDLGTHRLSLDDAPPQAFGPAAVPIETVDGELGFVAFSYIPRSCIYMWSRRRQPAAAAGGGANGGIGGAAGPWERHRIVELDALLPDPLRPRRSLRPNVYPFDAIRFAEGTNTIFISIYIMDNKGVFALDLKSRQLSKIGQRWVYPILPYMSFYTQQDLAKGKFSTS